MIDKNKHVPLEEFVYNPDRNLVHAHRIAYDKLLKELDIKNIKKDQTKN